MLASMGHLERMQQHRVRLASERARATALYAATVFSGGSPHRASPRGNPETTPNHDRLPQVLNRLRSYSADRAHARTAHREMFALLG